MHMHEDQKKSLNKGIDENIIPCDSHTKSWYIVYMISIFLPSQSHKCWLHAASSSHAVILSSQ